jgi:ATP-dependent Clp endopeptidase proteolytic subunit ClpP
MSEETTETEEILEEVPDELLEETVEEAEDVDTPDGDQGAEDAELLQSIAPLMFGLAGAGGAPEETETSNSVILYGDIDEENAADLVTSLLRKRLHKDPEDPAMAMHFYLSSWGGSAADMFSIYDTMNLLKQNREIYTYGLGKIMSAAVPILAAGTKGKRMIGKNCRVMIHGVIAGHHGPLFNLQNEMEEVKWTQEKYIDVLVKDTDMSRRYIKKLIDRKVNVYLDAKEAIELGIADEII